MSQVKRLSCGPRPKVTWAAIAREKYLPAIPWRRSRHCCLSASPTSTWWPETRISIAIFSILNEAASIRDVGTSPGIVNPAPRRSEEHTSELQSLMRISYAVLCLKKKKQNQTLVPQNMVTKHESTAHQRPN